MGKRYSLMLIVLIAGIVSASEFGLAAQIAQEGGEKPTNTTWLSGWLYRKAHNVTGSVAGPQVNYPLMLNVRFNSGTDVEGTVYLSGRCREDFGDVRFTDMEGNGLDYWIQQKADNVQALIWVNLDSIPAYPNNATLYLYYGNSNVSTTSNKHWTFDYIADFEEGTNGTWSKSWSLWWTWDGVAEQQAFPGNFCRGAGRTYGINAAGQGDFYDKFHDFSGAYLTAGSYWLQGAARFEYEGSGLSPIDISLLCDSASIASVTGPHTSWYVLGGNLTISEARLVSFSVQFHLGVSGIYTYTVDENYYIDNIILRRWCDPEPAHDSWGVEETWSEDLAPPSLGSVEWAPTAPPPFVPAAVPRTGESVEVRANATDIGSGLADVQLSYRMADGCWCNVSMARNATSGLWNAAIPGYPGNCSVEFFVTAEDFMGNLVAGEIQGYTVRSLPFGDIDGDGDVDIFDLVIAAGHYGESW